MYRSNLPFISFFGIFTTMSGICHTLNFQHSDYKISHHMGSMKINATPEGANFDFSGGELDVSLHPAHTIVKPVYYFHRTEQNIRNFYPMLKQLPLEREEPGRLDSRVLNYEKADGSGEETPSFSRSQHDEDEYTGGGGTREFFDPHIDRNGYHNRYLALRGRNGGKEWYERPSGVHDGSVRTVPETAESRENPSWIEEGRRRKAPISFFHRFGTGLNERNNEEAFGEHISPTKYNDPDTDAGSTIASIELQRPPEGDIDDFTKKVYPVDMGSGSSTVQSSNPIKESGRVKPYRRKHHRRHHRYRLPSIIIVKEEGANKANEANDGKGTGSSKATLNGESRVDRPIKADVSEDEKSDTRSATNHSPPNVDIDGSENEKAGDRRVSDLEEGRVVEDIKRIRNRFSHNNKERNESYRDGDDGDDDGEDDNVKGLVIDILGDEDQDAPKYRRKDRENMREFHRGHYREDSNGVDGDHNMADNRDERELPTGRHFEADDIHRYYNREGASRDRLNDEDGEDYGNYRGKEVSSRDQADAERKAYLPRVMEDQPRKKDSVYKRKSHKGMLSRRRHSSAGEAEYLKSTKHRGHLLGRQESVANEAENAVNNLTRVDHTLTEHKSTTKSSRLSIQNNKDKKTLVKDKLVFNNSAKDRRNRLHSDKVNHNLSNGLTRLNNKTKRQTRPSYLERLVHVLRTREIKQSFPDKASGMPGP